MKVISILILILLSSCTAEKDAKIKELTDSLKEVLDINKKLEAENKDLYKLKNQFEYDMETYKGFIESKKLSVLREDEILKIKELSVQYFYEDKNFKDMPPVQSYFDISKSLSKTCAALNYDLLTSAQNKNIEIAEKLIKGNAATKLKNLILILKILFPEDELTNFDLLVSTDIIMSGILKYDKNATEKEINSRLELWANTAKVFHKKEYNFDYVSSIKLAAFAVYLGLASNK